MKHETVRSMILTIVDNSKGGSNVRFYLSQLHQLVDTWQLGNFIVELQLKNSEVDTKRGTSWTLFDGQI